MYMTSNKLEEAIVGQRKQTTFITSDMVLDTYLASTKEKNKDKKKELLDNAIFLSQHLNEYIPLTESQYIKQSS
jgi:hypothetical protein